MCFGLSFPHLIYHNKKLKNIYNHIISFFLSPRLNQHLTFTNVEVALDFLFSSLTPSHYSSISNRGNQPQVTHWRFGHHTNAGRKVCTNCLFLLSLFRLSLSLSLPICPSPLRTTHNTRKKNKTTIFLVKKESRAHQ